MNINKAFFLLVAIVLLSFSCKRRIITTISTPSIPKDTIVHQIEEERSNAPRYTIEQLQAMRLDTLKSYYWDALEEVGKMLNDKQPLSFKRAVFITENAYLENSLKYESFCNEIQRLVALCHLYKNSNTLINYNFEDKEDVAKNGSIFKIMTDTIRLTNKLVAHYPFTYDFDDFTGNKDWSKMFITKLIETNSGNCHSLPFLYKIVANEIGAKAYLALAPNHVYLKHNNKQIGWYNTELTSGTFPIDAWLAASGYVTIEAIRAGIYMDSLSEKNSVALCLIDLAKGYERKFGSDSLFVISCTDLALKHFPNYVNALILKGETLKKVFEGFMKENNATYPTEIFHINSAKYIFTEMENTYLKAVKLGYREMPEEMYLDWLTLVQREKEKYNNKKVIKN